MFGYLKKDVLDIHELFEAGGNDPDARAAVVDTVERVVKEALLEERGSDFYALTANGKTFELANPCVTESKPT